VIIRLFNIYYRTEERSLSAINFYMDGSILTRPMVSLLEEIKSCDFEKLLLPEYKKTKNESYRTPIFHQYHLSLSTLVAPERGCIDLSTLNFGCIEARSHTCEWKIGDSVHIFSAVIEFPSISLLMLK